MGCHPYQLPESVARSRPQSACSDQDSKGVPPVTLEETSVLRGSLTLSWECEGFFNPNLEASGSKESCPACPSAPRPHCFTLF